MSQKIRIKLKSYDYNLVDKSADKIVKTVKNTELLLQDLYLSTHKKIFTVLRSPHVNKKSREQFKLCSYKRLLDIYSSSSKTVDALMKLELPSELRLKLKCNNYVRYNWKKIGMTSIYDESGKNIPCTILQVGPCTITQIKTDDKEGYSSFQLGFDEKIKNTTKSYEGHFKKVNLNP